MKFEAQDPGDVPGGTGESEVDDHRPITVRLGAVVPPEDPEDWRRPLTWAAAVGMLAAPLAAGVWFLVSAPQRVAPADPGTWVVAALLAAGGVLTGVTQRGRWRAFAGTVGAALFAAVATVAVAASIGPRTTEGVSPTLSHALAAGAGGVAAAVSVAPLMAVFADHASRVRLTALPLGLGSAMAIIVAALLMSPAQ